MSKRGLFRKRSYSSEDTGQRVARSADPYGQVGASKPSAGRLDRSDYTKSPDTVAPEEDPGASAPAPIIESGDPLEGAYRLIRSHSGVHFGAQLADGSWELSAPAPSQFAEMVSARIDSIGGGLLLDDAAAAMVQSGLQKYAESRRKS